MAATATAAAAGEYRRDGDRLLLVRRGSRSANTLGVEDMDGRRFTVSRDKADNMQFVCAAEPASKEEVTAWRAAREDSSTESAT